MFHVPPSIHKTAFSCPHCSAFTTQYWYTLYAKNISHDPPIPYIPLTDREKEVILRDPELSPDQKQKFIDYIDKALTGQVFFEENDDYCRIAARNLHVSICYNCKKIAVWVHDRLLFPRDKLTIHPNPDLPEDITRDFEEAREIADPSPRGAAALLRLCVQKLCKHLGEAGKEIDKDIGSLVKKGLDPLVQQSLDIVRVIGGEAVHPGVLDLRDDKETAFRLFEIVNAIADQMISHPKKIRTMYEKLPEAKRKAIEKRDQKKSE